MARGSTLSWARLLLETAMLAALCSGAFGFIRPPQPSGRWLSMTESSGGEGGPKRLTISEQLRYSPNRWKRDGKDLEPGVGGIWPGKPDARKYKVLCAAAFVTHAPQTLDLIGVALVVVWQVTVFDPRSGANFTLDVPEDRCAPVCPVPLCFTVSRPC
jgi:hypothetical protein